MGLIRVSDNHQYLNFMQYYLFPLFSLPHIILLLIGEYFDGVVIEGFSG